jgi:hypothetical protein
MPYIQKDDKKDLDKSITAIATALRVGDFRGKLNYSLNSIFVSLIEAKGMSYHLVNDFIGVLECAKLEAYRRVAAPYEDSKIVANGDIFHPSHLIINNCLSCGLQDKTFSVKGLCKVCVLKAAGFDDNTLTITTYDADIEDLSKNKSA